MRIASSSSAVTSQCLITQGLDHVVKSAAVSNVEIAPMTAQLTSIEDADEHSQGDVLQRSYGRMINIGFLATETERSHVYIST